MTNGLSLYRATVHVLRLLTCSSLRVKAPPLDMQAVGACCLRGGCVLLALFQWQQVVW